MKGFEWLSKLFNKDSKSKKTQKDDESTLHWYENPIYEGNKSPATEEPENPMMDSDTMTLPDNPETKDADLVPPVKDTKPDTADKPQEQEAAPVDAVSATQKKVEDLAQAKDTSVDPYGLESNPYQYGTDLWDDAYVKLKSHMGDSSVGSYLSTKSYRKIVDKVKDYIDTNADITLEKRKQKFRNIQAMCVKWLVNTMGDDTKQEKRIAIDEFLKHCIEADKKNRTIPYINSFNMETKVSQNLSQHHMNFNLDVDYPENNYSHTDGTIDGVKFEYWEKIHVLYNYELSDNEEENKQKELNHVGEQLKNWGDIYAVQPGAITFYDINARKEKGPIKNHQSFIFQDNPGYFPHKNSHNKRLVEFRIVVSTQAGQRREIYCNQLIENRDDKTILSSFNFDHNNPCIKDSMGDRNQATEAAKIGYGLSIPKDVLDAVPKFADSVKKGNANKCENTEYQAAQRYKESDQGKSLTEDALQIYKAISRAGEIEPGKKTGYELAGVNCMAMPLPGDEYFDKDVPGGKIVAIKNGDTIRKLYFTNNLSRLRTGEANGNIISLKARSFKEIPIELAEIKN